MRVVSRVLALVAAALAVLMATATPALAVDTPTSLAACRQGAGGASVIRQLDPRYGSVYTGVSGDLGLQFVAGAVVRVTATGRISYGGVFNWRGTWGPDGNGAAAPPDATWPYPAGPDAALVGQWNHTGTNQRIGSDSGCLVVPTGSGGAPVGLWLRANDDYQWDNGDVGYTVTVRVWALW